MAPILYTMPYIVWFKNQADYDFALSLSGGAPSLRIPPDTVAAMFGLLPFPNYPSGDVSNIPVSISFGSVFGPGLELRFPGPTGVFPNAFSHPYNVDCQPGTPASIWPCPSDDSHDAIFWWEAIWNFNRGAGVATSPPPAPTNMAQRRWCDGGVWGQFLEGGTTATDNFRQKGASRVPGGRGFAFRGALTAGGSGTYTHQVNQYRAGLTTHRSHERIYFRARNPDGTSGDNNIIWRCHNSLQPTGGCYLRYRGNGAVEIIDVTGFSVERSQGTLFTPVPFEWYVIDIYIKFGDGTAGSGRGRFVVNKGDIADIAYSPSDNSGLSLNGNHTESDIGPCLVGNPNVEWDVADWICTDLPANIDTNTLADDPTLDPPIDFLVGSHVRSQFSNPNVGSSTNWTGNRGVFNQGLTPTTQLTNQLISTTALARIEGLTDVFPLDTLDTQYVTIGVASAIIGLFSSNSANTDGQLGYRLAGGGDTLLTIDQINTLIARSVGYMPSGLPVPVEISPWSIVHTKSNDGNTDTVNAMVTNAEYLGVWGPEDDPVFEALGPRDYIHNSPYFNSPFGWYSGGSDAPVYAYGFTFVGNGTYQEFTLPAPAHFIKIRNTAAAANGGLNWFASMSGAVLGFRDRVVPGLRVWTDPTTSNCIMSVSGSGAEINQNAVTYQVIVFCDPGMRFLLCDAFSHGNGASQPKVNNLLFSNFTPECVFAAEQVYGSISNNDGLTFKGAAFAGNAGCVISGSALANWGTLAAGVINSRSDLHSGFEQALACWRSSEPGCTGTMVQIMTYVGNGAGARVINLTPVSGRFPLFVTVIPNNATTAVYRDPSHAGVNSCDWSNTNTINGITAVGVDTITVASALNTNLITYNVFAICGDTAGMNNGTYTNLYCALPTGGPFLDPPEFVPGPNIVGDGGIVLNGSSPLTLLKDASGIYTLVPGRRSDVLMDRQTGQTSLDVAIPNPRFKTGYLGG